jgi:secreted trypsin-like serine protease
MDEMPDTGAVLSSIAARLNAIVPTGFHLQVDGGTVLFGNSGSHTGEAYQTYLDDLTDPLRAYRIPQTAVRAGDT